MATAALHSIKTAAPLQQHRSSSSHWCPSRAPRQRTAVRRAAVAQQTAQDEAALLVAATRRIRDLGRKNKPKEAVEELASLAKAGIRPDIIAATATLDACRSKPDLALSIFEELFGTGDLLQPDEVACSVMLRALGDAQPPRWSAIASLLNRMERDWGLAPSTVTFNQLLAICCRTNDEGRAAELVSRMEVLGIKPDEYTWEAVRTKRFLRSLLKRTFA